MYLSPLRDLLGTQPLSLVDIGVCVGLSTLGYAAIRLDRIVHSGKRLAPLAPPGR